MMFLHTYSDPLFMYVSTCILIIVTMFILHGMSHRNRLMWIMVVQAVYPIVILFFLGKTYVSFVFIMFGVVWQIYMIYHIVVYFDQPIVPIQVRLDWYDASMFPHMTAPAA